MVASVEWAESFANVVAADFAMLGISTGGGAGQAIVAGPWGAGSYAFDVGGNAGDQSCWLRQALGAALATRYVGVRCLVPTLPCKMLLEICDGSGTQAWVGVDGTGHVTAGRGTNITPLGTSSGAVVQAGIWFYLEAKFLVAGSTAGAIVVRVNSTEVLNVTGIDTKPQTNASSNGVQFGGAVLSNFSTVPHVLIADAYTSASGFLGDVRMAPFAPTGAGAEAGFGSLVGAASQWQAIATEDGDTSYISSTTPGETTTATHAAVPLISGAIAAVVVWACARKDDAGARTIAPVMRLGSTDALGTITAAAITTAYAYYPSVFATDPGGGEWTFANLNSAELGVREVA